MKIFAGLTLGLIKLLVNGCILLIIVSLADILAHHTNTAIYEYKWLQNVDTLTVLYSCGVFYVYLVWFDKYIDARQGEKCPLSK